MSVDFTPAELLARLDERTKAIQNDMQELKKDLKTIDDIYTNRLTEFEKKIEEKVEKHFEKSAVKYVTKDSFDPVKKIVYGLVGLILTAVAGAIISLAVIKPPIL